jgi:hypothetical protein
MNTKKIQEFNRIYNELLVDINTNFELETDNKNDDLETIDNLKYYLENVMGLMDRISVCDDNLFKEDIYLISGINFKTVWEKSSLKNKEILWKYLHTLYILSTSTPQIHELLNTIEDKNIHECVDNNMEIISNIVSSRKRLQKEFQEKMRQENKDKNTSKPSNGGGNMISNLAEELAGEIDISELSADMTNPGDILKSMLSGGENSSLGKIIQKVSSTLTQKIDSGELDESALFSEAQGMMGNMGGGGMGGMGDLLSELSGQMNQTGGAPKTSSRKIRRKLKRKNKRKILKKKDKK